jgi:hypothetical protein
VYLFHAWFFFRSPANAREHKTSHSDSLREFGLDANAIRDGLAPFFEQYQWDADSDEAVKD